MRRELLDLIAAIEHRLSVLEKKLNLPAGGVRRKPLVFLSPSLSSENASKILDADYRPPVRRGDLVRALAEGYRTIGIVDGVFHQGLSVSLQEIRYAIERGAKIYGAASMGAIRAAAAYPLGMIGVGRIYEWYRSETLDSDDEVAVCFDPENGRSLSEPLVNMRATLEDAVREGVLDGEESRTALREASSLHFTDRNYESLLRRLTAPTRDRFRSYVSEHARDLKKEDTVALLERIKHDGLSA